MANQEECKQIEVSTTSSIQDLQVLEECVQELFDYRDHYFEHHSIEEASLKEDRLKEKLKETVKTFEEYNKSGGVRPEWRARFYYMLGQANNVLAGYNEHAESMLTRAVKLDPQMVDGWNELGESYWKKADVREATNCFEAALAKKKNFVSLRSLSMLMRQEAALQSSSPQEKVARVEQGLAYAREAVALDASQSQSWLVLGNSYLTHFFNVKHDPQTLKQAMAAYRQAEADPLGKNDSFLHYNKGMALKFEEEYEEALRSFALSARLDPSFAEASDLQRDLVAYLDNTIDLIKAHGRLKAKKLNALLQSIDRKQLGPYMDGAYKGAPLAPRTLSQLAAGLNAESVVLGVVICSVHCEQTLPFTFCLMDSERTVVAVTVYNLARGKGVIIGDCVAIPEPYVTNFSFSFDSKKYRFTSVRVDNPLVLVVNGKKVGRDHLASLEMSSFLSH